MSYTKKYKERISVPYSGSVRYTYPASKNGGSSTVNYKGTTHEDVTINIKVDTSPFDKSVDSCNTNVDLLTGAVVATEAAQIASILQNSKKVANTIIEGFFGLIRSEISQQITELSQSINSQLIHLRELSKSVIDKKRQMEGDFLRISSRYIKIFDDLNKELSNRVYELDKPTFLFKKELDGQGIRSTNNDLVNTVVVFGKEGNELYSKISTSITKKRAFDAINKAKIFLIQQKNLNYKIQQSMLNEDIESTQYLPVCFIESAESKEIKSKTVHGSKQISQLDSNTTKNRLVEDFTDNLSNWENISVEHSENLKLYFNQELNKKCTSSEEHNSRVKIMIQKLAKFDSIKVVGIQ